MVIVNLGIQLLYPHEAGIQFLSRLLMIFLNIDIHAQDDFLFFIFL